MYATATIVSVPHEAPGYPTISLPRSSPRPPPGWGSLAGAAGKVPAPPSRHILRHLVRQATATPATHSNVSPSGTCKQLSYSVYGYRKMKDSGAGRWWMVSQSVIKASSAATDAYVCTFTWKDPRFPLSHVDVFRNDNNIKRGRWFKLFDKASRCVHIFQHSVK